MFPSSKSWSRRCFGSRNSTRSEVARERRRKHHRHAAEGTEYTAWLREKKRF